MARADGPDPAVFVRGLGFEPRDVALYAQAFTHSSVVNESAPGTVCNERLEHLGDAVLGAVVSEDLFLRHPECAEGSLSKRKAHLVDAESLGQWALKLGMDRLMRLGRGEEKGGGRTRPALLADAFEAFVGALFLDLGYDAARAFLKPMLEERAQDKGWMDPKSALQEALQRLAKAKPDYRIEASTGPDHLKCYTVAVFQSGELLGRGQGPNKKAAEKAAAADALGRLGA